MALTPKNLCLKKAKNTKSKYTLSSNCLTRRVWEFAEKSSDFFRIFQTDKVDTSDESPTVQPTLLGIFRGVSWNGIFSQFWSVWVSWNFKFKRKSNLTFSVGRNQSIWVNSVSKHHWTQQFKFVESSRDGANPDFIGNARFWAPITEGLWRECGVNGIDCFLG